MAFKPGTPVIGDSAGSRLAQTLAAAGRDVTTYDRLASRGEQQALAGSIRVAESATEALAGASVVVVALAESEYLRAVETWRPGAPGTVLDCWRALDGKALDGLVTRIALGRGARGAEQEALAA
jgi:UDP-N-acetyl-D-mannosaminuronate dehydrogenase